MAYIHVFVTGTSDDFGGERYIEEHGWIDPSWSWTVLHESRNDAGTILSIDENDEDLQKEIADLIVGYDNNGDGTFYSVDSVQDAATGVYWSYALHFVRKFYGPNGWTEENYVPEVSK